MNSKSKSKLGQSTVASKEIEQLLKGILRRHLSSVIPGKQYVGGVIGDLVISPSDGLIEWLPGTTKTTPLEGAAS
jgi:hypothetical protein